MDNSEPTLETIREAGNRIRNHITLTPLLSHPELDERLGCSVLLKCENMQYCGAFKSRGACNAVFSLSDQQAQRGVCAHSSGNHAAALARAAKRRGIAAHIVMPSNSRPNKLQAVRDLGVEPTLSGPTNAEREATTRRVLSETGAELIHPFDDYRVIAGQGTAALEMLQQTAPPDVLIVPLGGGGLLAGSLLAVKSICPNVQVIAAEPKWADDGYRSWKTGSIQQPDRYDTCADGLRTSVGQRTFPIMQRLLDDIILCSEEAILSATRLMMNVAKIVAEPSGAVPIAAITESGDRFRGLRVAVIVSGGNAQVQL